MNQNLQNYLKSKLEAIPIANATMNGNPRNPKLPELFTDSLRIQIDLDFFPTKQKDYLDLRDTQNKDHAYDLTVQGIELARKDQLNEAIKKYDTALDIYENVETFVARGAAKANLSMFDGAKDDLKRALALDPSHANALKYLHKLEINQRKRRKDESYYRKCLKNGEFVMQLSNTKKKYKTLEDIDGKRSRKLE